MDNIVYVKEFGELPVNKKEILRYASAKETSIELDEKIDECIKEISLKSKVCFCEFPIKFYDDYIDLSFFKSQSKDLRKNLKDCSSIVLFCATVGFEIDRLIWRYSTVSPLKSLLFQAIGTERIESLCGAFNEYIKEEKRSLEKFTRPRFSAGYGDFPIEAQKDIIRVLDAPRKIGVTLNESLLMSPSKSVTAIIGISDKNVCEEKKECEICKKKDCEYRRRNENT